MPIVSETLDLPGGASPEGVKVEVVLAGENGDPYPAGYGSVAGTTIVGVYRTETDDAGTWAVTLPANDEITPSGTVWRIVLSGRQHVDKGPRYIEVPTVGGPYTVEDLLTDPPTTIVPIPLAVETAARVAADAALQSDYFAALALDPDGLIVGTVIRDSTGAATSAEVVWPDGTAGTYTADVLSTAFPGAVDAYHVTYGSPASRTYTQPEVTRDSNGAVTTRPAIEVS